MTELLRQLLALILSGLLLFPALAETKCTATYPNGVVHGYTYDTRNRLTNLALNNSTAPIHPVHHSLEFVLFFNCVDLTRFWFLPFGENRRNNKATIRVVPCFETNT